MKFAEVVARYTEGYDRGTFQLTNSNCLRAFLMCLGNMLDYGSI